ncbi:hypothetical protein PAE9249_02453 [Paenibacillus sp. CECT 9249]|nr:hypothetical protein PAE9249_02453 [Paenibacillus sp. CECT 9249]
MPKPFTKPVIIDPYFDAPAWMDNNVDREELIILSADSTDEDVELFFRRSGNVRRSRFFCRSRH